MYCINDCVLIRKTSVLPIDGIVETPIHGRAYGFGDSDLLHASLLKRLRQLYPNFDQLVEESKKYQIYFETYRRTIHFTINGIVENSLYGTFNYPYIIIEPLKYHISDKSLEGLRVEDTYFSDDLVLSTDAILLMREEDYKKVKDSIRGLKVSTFRRDENQVVKEVLKEQGYDFFVVNNNGYVKGLDSGTPDQEMYEFICHYGQEHGISLDRHFYSSFNQEDARVRMEAFQEMDKAYVIYLLDSGFVDNELSSKIRFLLDNPYDKRFLDELFDKMIEQIGLVQLHELTKNFNQMQLERRNEEVKKKK